jgi:hypothetical protein
MATATNVLPIGLSNLMVLCEILSQGNYHIATFLH